ncbi:glycoside hydrolase family 104 protein [Phytobacter diazotrophicus]|uniref:glycoside hydrolase family 24 protein n=1 Tax=Phytobacter diazotrophicus TaxID=395631 RepID=UPI002FF9B765
MLAWSEGTSTIKASDNGYNVLVGGGLFNGYADHPRQLIDIPRLKIKSTAAGRYQLLSRYWDVYRKQLGLKDFSPASQDAVAIQQIKERKALQLISDGKINQAIEKCSNIWASLPGAGYGQHEHKIDDLLRKYVQYGGSIS